MKEYQYYDHKGGNQPKAQKAKTKFTKTPVKKRVHSSTITTTVGKELSYDPDAKGYFSEQNPVKTNKYGTQLSYPDYRDKEHQKKKKK